MRAVLGAGMRTRYVDAAALVGHDKARHTTEVKRAHNAQARRFERHVDAALALAV